MYQESSWAEYARLQTLAGSLYLSAQAQAADLALNTILDRIERREAVSTQQADNLLANRARTIRKQHRLLAQHIYLFDRAVHHNGRLEVCSECAWLKKQCDDREWQVLVLVGLGHTYKEIAKIANVPESTIKTLLRRLRLKLSV